jgi:hypothetical protein
MSGWRKTVRKVGSAVGSVFVLGPAWVGAVGALQDATAGGGFKAEQFAKSYVYFTSGYDIGSNKFDSGYFASAVVPRAAVLVGLGLFVKWLARRA